MYEGALELLNFELKKDYNEELLFLKADVLDKLNQHDESLKCCDELIKRNPGAHTWRRKAYALSNYHKRYQEAITLYHKCLNEYPGDTWALQSMADVYVELGEYLSARTAYDKALLFEENSKYSMEYVVGSKSAMIKLAYDHLQKGDLKNAESFLLEADEISFLSSNKKYRIAPEEYFKQYDEGADPYSEIRGNISLLDTTIKMGKGMIHGLREEYVEALHYFPDNGHPLHMIDSMRIKARCFAGIDDTVSAVYCYAMLEQYGEDVKEQLDFYQKSHFDDLEFKKRDPEKIMNNLVTISNRYLQGIMNDSEVVEANVLLTVRTAALYNGEMSYERLFQMTYDDADNELALTVFAAATALLCKYEIPISAYHKWVLKQENSIRKLLYDLGDEAEPKFNGEEKTGYIKLEVIRGLGEYIGDYPVIPSTIFDEPFETRMNFVKSEIERMFIKYQNISMEQPDAIDEVLIPSLKAFKKNNIVPKHAFFEEERQIIGLILSPDAMERQELLFIKEAERIYSELGINSLGRNFFNYNDSRFDVGRFIHAYKHEDRFLFSCMEKRMIFNAKEGFVIGSEYLYSFGWNNPLAIRNISFCFVRDGEIWFELKNGKEQVKPFIYFVPDKEDFAHFMNRLIAIWNGVTVYDIAESFSKESLEGVVNGDLPSKGSFGGIRKEGIRVLIPSLGEDQGGRLFEFYDINSASKAKEAYDINAKKGPDFFSHVHQNGRFLLQMTGKLDVRVFANYTKTMDETLNETNSNM